MPGIRVALCGALALIAVGVLPDERSPRTLVASSSGPVPARTGGFGEMTCYQCHWDNPLNDATGRISLSGITETYYPGERYPITVAIAHPELVRGGFQMSARFEDGSNAGIFESPDELTETVRGEDGRISYVQHTAMGSRKTQGKAQWTVQWTAPASGGPVVFHVAANASNGDASPLGDFIYTTSATSRPR